MSTAELVRLIGFKSSRELQLVIAHERDKGHLILSTGQDGGGYFLPDDGEKGRAELRDFVRTLQNRGTNTFKAIRAAKAALSDGGR